MFFIDHNEKKTSWIDPRTGRASPMPSQTRPPEDNLGPLPEGNFPRKNKHANKNIKMCLLCFQDGKNEFMLMVESSLLITVSSQPQQQKKITLNNKKKKQIRLTFLLNSHQIHELHNGKIQDYRIQILPAKQYLILEIINKSTSILRVS